MRLDGSVQPVGTHEPSLSVHKSYPGDVETYLVRSEELDRSALASASWESKSRHPVKIALHNRGYRLVNDGTHARLFRFGNEPNAYLVFPKQKQIIPAGVLEQAQVKAVKVKKIPSGYKLDVHED